MSKKIIEFQKKVWQFYYKNGRVLPWRIGKGKKLNAYRVWVSEIMLQQTQVSRVIPKYESFLKKFPTVKILAEASLSDVLTEWKGLGYNRRGLNLKKSAEIIMKEYGGVIPLDETTLVVLPGIGTYTARALITFLKDVPLCFIETNIRTAFFDHFFKKRDTLISDKELLLLIEKALPKKNFREWYYALMDYGSFLKQSSLTKKIHQKSTLYRKQTVFKDSYREKRSTILDFILKNPNTNVRTILENIQIESKTLTSVLGDLEKEGFIKNKKGSYKLC